LRYRAVPRITDPQVADAIHDHHYSQPRGSCQREICILYAFFERVKRYSGGHANQPMRCFQFSFPAFVAASKFALVVVVTVVAKWGGFGGLDLRATKVGEFIRLDFPVCAGNERSRWLKPGLRIR
jgi:hypothetical protein